MIRAVKLLDQKEILEALREDNTEIIKEILKYDNKEEILTKCKALHIACVRRSVNVVELLLKNNITSEINTKRKIHYICSPPRRVTPLEIACTGRRKVAQLMKLLLLYGADPNTEIKPYRDFEDLTLYPIHVAARKLKLDLIKTLVEKGADVNKLKVSKRGFNIVYKNTALSLIANFTKYKGETPKHVECVRYLLEVGCDPNIPIYSWIFPLYAAIRNSLFGMTKVITVGQRNYFTIFFRTLRQFHIIISVIDNGLFNASCDL